MVQIVKGPTDSKSSAQGASAADARIGKAPDGLYGNLIKKAEAPLTRSAIASARDDIILFAAANDNNLTTFKQAI